MTAVVLIALMLNALTVLLVLYLVYRGDKALGDFEPYLRDVDNIRSSISRRGNQILEKTITVAQEMIRNAVYTSQRNIKNSEILQSEMEKAIKEGVAQNLSENKQIMQKATQEIIDAYQKQFSLMSRDIESAGVESHQTIMEASKSKIDELSAGIQTELSSVRKTAEEKIAAELLSSQENIRSYREQKIKELDDKVYQVLGEVAKKTIGKAIDLSTHEELVMEALAKAKREKLI